MKNTTPENLAEVINDTEPRRIPKPVEHVAVELSQVDSALSILKNDFQKRGLSEGFLSLGALIRLALIEAEQEWVNGRWVTGEKRAQWEELSALSDEKLGSFVDELEMALWDNEDAMRSIAQVEEGKGPEDMLLDLPLVAGVARNHYDAVIAGGITEEDIVDIETLATEASVAFTAVNMPPEVAEQLKVKRDKVKTVAADYLSLIRFYADRIYRKDAEKRSMFVSAYSRQVNISTRS